ncbi:MAG TPA: hypothetical protein P5098_02060 [Candidatus Dojkabacteria bacterium]|nr:hypothetical protein [Candidatus Dojkabacteria bacterium]
MNEEIVITKTPDFGVSYNEKKKELVYTGSKEIRYYLPDGRMWQYKYIDKAKSEEIVYDDDGHIKHHTINQFEIKHDENNKVIYVKDWSSFKDYDLDKKLCIRYVGNKTIEEPCALSYEDILKIKGKMRLLWMVEE